MLLKELPQKAPQLKTYYFIYSQPFSLFLSIQYNKQMFKINISDDWIRATDLWCSKRPLCQLSHNHCPLKHFLVHKQLNIVHNALPKAGSNNAQPENVLHFFLWQMQNEEQQLTTDRINRSRGTRKVRVWDQRALPYCTHNS